MRDHEKKKDDEMLVTHLPKPEPVQEGREPTLPAARELAEASLDELTTLLRAASRRKQRSEVIAEIQRRFGNEAAENVVAEVRAREDGASST